MIQVVDPVKDYVELMKTIVDFGQIKTFLAGSEISVWLIFITLENTLVHIGVITNLFSETNFKLLINSLHGATGPYVEAIFK